MVEWLWNMVCCQRQQPQGLAEAEIFKDLNKKFQSQCGQDAEE